MDRRIIQTGDGSYTVSIPEMDVTYHSKHGAIQESRHVFIEAGFQYLLNQSPTQLINIFEMGFGTGLNVFLTAIEAANIRKPVRYITVEQFPLSTKEALSLNYAKSLDYKEWFDGLHKSKWNEEVKINEYFTFRKEQSDFITYSTPLQFDIIYYDAFEPSAQPELWTEEVFKKLNAMLLPGGIFISYCSKSDVRRALHAAGFKVEKIPGPPGKREMVRAFKI